MIVTVQMKRLVYIAAMAAVTCLTGCMMGPDFERPVVEPPEHFSFTDAQTEAVVNLKWWELFNDPALDSLVATALNNNKDVMIVASRIEQARASLGFTEADTYPRLDIEAGASRGNYVAGRKVDKDDNYFIAPTVSWEVDFWGKFRRANEAALAELMASESSLRTIQISLISEVVSTYFLWLDFQQRLEISRQTRDSRLDSLEIIEARFSKGIIPEIDVNQSQIQKEIAEASIPVFTRTISQIENALNILLGSFCCGKH